MNLIDIIKRFLAHVREGVRDLDRSDGKLRHFGYIVGTALLLIGFWGFVRTGSSVAIGAVLVGFLLLLLSALSLRSLDFLYCAWMTLGILLSIIVGPILLTILFVCVITPFGILRRLLGSDPLSRSLGMGRETYWVAHTKRPSSHTRHPF